MNGIKAYDLKGICSCLWQHFEGFFWMMISMLIVIELTKEFPNYHSIFEQIDPISGF